MIRALPREKMPGGGGGGSENLSTPPQAFSLEEH